MLPWSRPLFTPASVHARLCSRSQRREPLPCRPTRSPGTANHDERRAAPVRRLAHPERAHRRRVPERRHARCQPSRAQPAAAGRRGGRRPRGGSGRAARRAAASFWRENEVGKGIDAFAFVLRAVLANSPNSIPPERVFSILNDTFDDDQDNSYADYIELALQLQFNERSRSQE